MSFGSILKFAWRNMFRKGSHLLAGIIYGTCMFFIIAVLTLMTAMNSSLLSDIKNVTGYRADKVFYASCDNMSSGGKVNLGKDISSISGVKYAGNLEYIDATDQCLRELMDIQDGHCEKDRTHDPYSLETVYMDKGIWDMCHITLSEGKLNTDESGRLYLGCQYRGRVKLGTEYINGAGQKYTVSGFIKKGSYVIDDNLSMLDTRSSVASIPLDYAVVQVNDSFLFSDSFCLFVSDKDADSVKSSISELSENYGENVILKNVGSVIADLNRRSEPARRMLIILLILVTGMTSIMMVCFQLSRIISEERNMGIYYSSGMSDSDISKIYTAESVIRLMAALILSIPLILVPSYLMIHVYAEYERLKILLLTRALPLELILLAAVVLISSALPLQVIKKLSPMELMRGRI